MATSLTLRQLHCFLAVAELGSFTRAAERMGMAQPGLSQQIRDLEGGLGVRLFDRTTRRVELTESGQEFHLTAARVTAELTHAARHAKEFAERKRGRVRVAASPLLASVVLPAAIARFHTDFPGVTVGLTETRATDIVALVQSGQADCGFGTFTTDDEGLEIKPVAADRLMVFCQTGHPLTLRPGTTWAELAGLPLITLAQESSLRALVEQGYAAARVAFAPAYEFQHIFTALSCVAAGLGVAVLPAYAATAIHARSIMARPLTQPAVSRNISLLTSARRSKSPAMLAFSRYLIRHTRENLPRAARG